MFSSLFSNNLDKCTLTNTPVFKIPEKIKKCKIVKVIDGDTVKVAMKPFLFAPYYIFNVRLLGVDADEIRTKDLEEKKQGYKIKKYLENLLTKNNKYYVYIRCDKFDNFGRILGELYFDKNKLNNINILVSDYIRKLNT